MQEQKTGSSSALSVQVGGDHYKQCKIQPVETTTNNVRFNQWSSLLRTTLVIWKAM